MNLKFLKTLAYINSWMYSSSTISPVDNWKVLHKDKDIALLTNDTTCIYAFRGTANGEDIMEDLRAFVNEYSCMMSEEPFNGELFGVALPLFEQLIDIPACPTDDVYFTGHSLGGSLAATVGWMRGETLGKPRVVTFGEPPSCCLKGQLVDDHLRVVNGHPGKHDPIPGWRKGFINHCESSQVFWLDSKTIDGDDDTPYDFKLQDIHMHSIANYIYSLGSTSSIMAEI